MNGKVLMLAIIFFGGFHVFYAFNRVQNFANIMYRLCAIQLGECLMDILGHHLCIFNTLFTLCALKFGSFPYLKEKNTAVVGNPTMCRFPWMLGLPGLG